MLSAEHKYEIRNDCIVSGAYESILKGVTTCMHVKNVLENLIQNRGLPAYHPEYMENDATKQLSLKK